MGMLKRKDVNTKVVATKGAAKGTSDFSLWGEFIWKFLRSLIFTVAGGALIYLVCRWLIS